MDIRYGKISNVLFHLIRVKGDQVLLRLKESRYLA